MMRAADYLLIAMAAVLLLFVAFGKRPASQTNPIPVMPSQAPDAAKAASHGAQALASYNAGHMQESVDASLQAIRLNPGVAGYHNTLCAAYNNLQKYDLALAACEHALQIDPAFALARNNLAWALNHKDK